MRKIIGLLAVITVIATGCELGRPFRTPSVNGIQVLHAECAIHELGTLELCQMYPGQTLPGGSAVVFARKTHVGHPRTWKIDEVYRPVQNDWVPCASCFVMTGTRGGTFAPSLPDNFHPFQTDRSLNINGSGNWSISWPFFTTQNPNGINISGCIIGNPCS